MERRRLLVAALHDHALAGADAVVAGRAVDVVALLAAQQHVAACSGSGFAVDRRAVDVAGEERLVLVEMAARHRARHQRPRGALVGEERAALERLVLRLVVHVLAAAGEHASSERAAAATRGRDAAVRDAHHCSTCDTWRGLQAREEAPGLVEVELRIGRLDAEEEASREASAKRGTLNTG